jgi:deoxyadenosine/deoxycytidine kinase
LKTIYSKTGTLDKKIRMKWVSIEGLIGVGKSTFLEQMKDQSFTLIPEPVEDWVFLEDSYVNPKVYSFPAQIEFFTSRVAKFRSLFQGEGLYISERSVFSDKVFWNTKLELGDIDVRLHALYLKMWSLWQDLLPIHKPDVFIYLDTNLEECMRRVKERNRGAESTLTIDYQRILKQEHEKIFFDPEGVLMPDGSRVPCVVIDASEDFRRKELTKKYVKVIKEIIG